MVSIFSLPPPYGSDIRLPLLSSFDNFGNDKLSLAFYYVFIFGNFIFGILFLRDINTKELYLPNRSDPLNQAALDSCFYYFGLCRLPMLTHFSITFCTCAPIPRSFMLVGGSLSLSPPSGISGGASLFVMNICMFFRSCTF